MKELSIEQKAKAYDEALDRARKINSGDGVEAPLDWTICETIFPELKESEDEEIRRALIHIVKGACNKYGIKYQGTEIGEEKLLAWLEKQDKKKPAWSEEDEKTMSNLLSLLLINIPEQWAKYGKWLKSLKYRVQPKQEWNEEDKQYFNFLEKLLICLQAKATEGEIKKGTNSNSEYYYKVIQWLKSLRPQNTWRPNEEQIRTMEYLAKYYAKGCDEPTRSIIKGLYEQLKQL